MRLLRTVALRVSRFVVRYASSGCKEWAEGLAREVEFIEDDWSALRWAMGSTRVLFDRREAPMTSPDDILVRARRLSVTLRKSNYNHVFLFFLAFTYLLRILDAVDLQQRIGCGLVVAGAVFMGVSGMLMRPKQQAPQGNDAGTWVLYYRAALERRLSFFRTSRGRGAQVVLTLYLLGVLLSQKGGVLAHVVFSTLLVLAYLLGTWTVILQMRGAQRQLDELDAVLREPR